MNRTFAIINSNDNITINDVINNIVSKIKSEHEIYIFTNKSNLVNDTILSNIKIINISDDCDNDSKIKNFVSKYFKDNNFKDYLYVFEDNVKVNEDKFNLFLPMLEDMMSKLHLNTWFNTTLDECNYIFNKFDCRFKIMIDNPTYSKIFNKPILWTSHANTGLICYDLNNITYEKMAFDDRFSIAMFYIIKYIADRRNDISDTAWPFMNLYPTIMEEYKVIEHFNKNNSKQTSNSIMKTEHEMFISLNIDNHPDGDVDKIMSFIVDNLDKWRSENIK